MDTLADTCFFIDLQRRATNALTWIERNPDARILASIITYGELAAGQPDRNRLDQGLMGVPMLSVDAEIAWIFGGIATYLRSRGSMVGANDAWIAATALLSDLPVLTRNVDEFSRVPGLKLETY